MLRLAAWKVASILALILVAALLVVPSFLSAETVASLEAKLPSFIPVRPIVLGLDLQGGARVLLELQPTKEVPTITADVQEQVETVVQNRVNGLFRDQ